MKSSAYTAVRTDPRGAGVKIAACGAVHLFGRDRQTFLQGQVTNDVIGLKPGQGAHACLLDSKGHLLADLYIHAFADHLLIETQPECAGLVAAALDRFLVREKVQIEDVSTHWQKVTVQGQGALSAVQGIVVGEISLVFASPIAHVPVRTVVGDVEAFIVSRPHTTGVDGYDLWLPAEYAPGAVSRLKATDGVVDIDEETLEILRIEAGFPKWGAELDNGVIPLEAGMEDAISLTKGCYVGQEVIARIRGRGHTNRSLKGLKLSQPVAAGEKLLAKEGARAGEEIGSITSSAISPEAGPIALGYVRNEYAQAGVQLSAGDILVTVTDLPFVV